MRAAVPTRTAAMPGRPEFVCFVAALVAVYALGVDLMLPALTQVGRDLAIATANQRQWIITVYILGFGIGQLFYGPLIDRFGRKRTLLATVLSFAAASLFAAQAATLTALLGARFLQGLMAASTRVLAVAITRDRYAGREMARVMSLAQMIFFLVPILAPALGQALLLVGQWRVIFYALGGYAILIALWSSARVPETLPPDQRNPLSAATLRRNYRATLTDRLSVGYACAMAMTFGGIIAFVSCAQQIFADQFGVGKSFTGLFAICAFAMGCASFVNSRLVERLGTRMISQSAVLALIVVSLAHLAIIAMGLETLVTFMTLQALSMACIGLCGANFGSMAMEPMGHIAGVASSVQGFITTAGATIVGIVIGQSYHGTTWPLATGYLIIGLTVLVLIFAIERGKLFRIELVGIRSDAF